MSQQLTPEQKNALQQVYVYANDMKRQGMTDSAIIKELESQGMSRDAARTVVYNLSARSSGNNDDAFKQMAMGGLICVVGIFITIGTMSAAKGGGTYIVAYGAIISGAIQFIRGLSRYNQG